MFVETVRHNPRVNTKNIYHYSKSTVKIKVVNVLVSIYSHLKKAFTGSASLFENKFPFL